MDNSQREGEGGEEGEREGEGEGGRGGEGGGGGGEHGELINIPTHHFTSCFLVLLFLSPSALHYIINYCTLTINFATSHTSILRCISNMMIEWAWPRGGASGS